MSKPMGPDVTRANTVLVWHVGQIGRRMGMLSPLVQAGALQNSRSPVDTEGCGDEPSVEPPRSRRWSILLTFEKLMYWSKPNQTRPPSDACRAIADRFTIRA